MIIWTKFVFRNNQRKLKMKVNTNVYATSAVGVVEKIFLEIQSCNFQYAKYSMGISLPWFEKVKWKLFILIIIAKIGVITG
jgi:hypothetical protein